MHGQSAFVLMLENTGKNYQTSIHRESRMYTQSPFAYILDFTVFLQVRVHSTIAAYHTLPSLQVKTRMSQSCSPWQSRERRMPCSKHLRERYQTNSLEVDKCCVVRKKKQICSNWRTAWIQSIQWLKFTASSFGKFVTTVSQKYIKRFRNK